MIARFLVNIIRVMTGIGRVKLRTTWLMTNVRVGSSPRAIATKRGNHRGDTTDPYRDSKTDKSLHDNLTRHGPHVGAGNPRGDQ